MQATEKAASILYGHQVKHCMMLFQSNSLLSAQESSRKEHGPSDGAPATHSADPDEVQEYWF